MLFLILEEMVLLILVVKKKMQLSSGSQENVNFKSNKYNKYKVKIL